MKNKNDKIVRYCYRLFYFLFLSWCMFSLFPNNFCLSIPIKKFPLKMIDWGVSVHFILLIIIAIVEKNERKEKTFIEKLKQELQNIKKAFIIMYETKLYLLLLFLYSYIDIQHFFNSESLKEIPTNTDYLKIYFFKIIIILFEQFYVYVLLELAFDRKIKNYIPITMIIIEMYVLFNGFFFKFISNSYYISTGHECRIILYSKVLSYDIVVKLFAAIIFYFIKKKMWSGNQKLIDEILKTEKNIIITEKPETWNKLKNSLKKLDAKFYKNLKFEFLKYDSCLLDSNEEKFSQSEILLSICEYNKLFKNENLRIFVFEIDTLGIDEKFKYKFNSNDYCKLGNNVYIIRYSVSENENKNREFFDILNKIFEEKYNQIKNE